MNCPSCGNYNTQYSSFCSNCGSPLVNEPPEPTQAIPVVSPGSPIPIVAAGQDPQANTNYQNLMSGAPISTTPQPKKSRKGWIIAAVLFFFLGGPIVTIALFAGGLLSYVSFNGDQTASQSALTSTESTTTSTKPTSKKVAPASPSQSVIPVAGFDVATLNQIVSKYPGSAVAAANGDNLYESPAANDKRINAGFYVPVWMAAKESTDYYANKWADQMMMFMDNDAGNEAISEMGGLAAVNNWLDEKRWVLTSFGRKFGDTQASANGYENYTSARDAVGIMQQALAYDLPTYMNAPLAEEGVQAPIGWSISGHRGQGIQNMWSYYIVMRNGNKTVLISVITQGIGQTSAVALTNEVLANVALRN